VSKAPLDVRITAYYAKFRRGDHLTDAEMAQLIRAIKAAMPFLESYSHFALVRNQARTDLYALEGYMEFRRKDRK
jgi:hypothetical protein